MFGRNIWLNYPNKIFENFEIAQIKRGHFKIFKIHVGDLSQRLPEPNM